jgi:uncharacterized membrane protein YagU involved in acid resistance
MSQVLEGSSQKKMVHHGIAGVIGGLAGGVVFGILMGMMGMLPMIASMVGSDSAVVGFILHMGISAFIGATFGLLFGDRSRSYQTGLGFGLLYGGVWWVLGPLVIMPLMMGMGLQFGAAFTQPMLMSLMGHLLYGAVTGVVFVWYSLRR